jgi:Phage terminase large subunit (GpA)
MGLSTASILWTLWLCRSQKANRGIIYWLPTDGDVSDFVKTKVDSLVSENPDISEHLSTGPKSGSYNQGLKFFWNVPTYWRGLKSKVGVKAISADAAVYDEYDEADQSQVSQARKRLSASELKLERELSTPTIPDFGIDKQFQETDQCHYAFRCPHCSTWNILEEQFPECFQQKADGSYYPGCKRCKGKLDLSSGTWVQKESRNVVRGYQVSQLYSPFVSANEIMREFHTTEFVGHFYNHVLGVPYLSATDKLTREMVLSLCDPMRQMTGNYISQTAMGIDVGSVLHITVVDQKNKKIVWIGELTHFEDVDKLMIKFNTVSCVIDALPETRKVKELINRNRTKVWSCFYNENLKGDYAWKEDERIVTVNRTESLDASTFAVIRKEYTLPQRNKMIETFADHCANIAKVVEEDKNTGARKYVYKKTGPDHYRHSFNYAMIAASRMRGSIISVMR